MSQRDSSPNSLTLTEAIDRLILFTLAGGPVIDEAKRGEASLILLERMGLQAQLFPQRLTTRLKELETTGRIKRVKKPKSQRYNQIRLAKNLSPEEAERYENDQDAARKLIAARIPNVLLVAPSASKKSKTVTATLPATAPKPKADNPAPWTEAAAKVTAEDGTDEAIGGHQVAQPIAVSVESLLARRASLQREMEENTQQAGHHTKALEDCSRLAVVQTEEFQAINGELTAIRQLLERANQPATDNSAEQ